MTEYIIFGLIVLFSSFVQSTLGFGFSIVAMPLLVIFFPIKLMVPVVVILILYSTALNSYKFKKHIDIKCILIPFIFSLIGRTVGVSLLMSLKVQSLEIILGALIFSTSLYFMFLQKKISIKENFINGSLTGAISGLTGGLFSIGGPPIVMYLITSIKEKNRYFASIQFYFFLGALHGLGLHIYHNNINIDVLIYATIAFIFVLFGSYLGRLCYHKFDKKILNKATYIFLMLSSLRIIIEGLL